MGFLMPAHPFFGVFSRNNLPTKNRGWGIRNKPW